MIDATNLKAPGWRKVVEELSSASPDDRAFLDCLLRVLAQVSAARQAVLFIPASAQSGETHMRPLSVFPPPVAMNPSGPVISGMTVIVDDGSVQNVDEARRAAFACFESGQSRIFSLDAQADMLYDGAPGAGYVLAVPLAGVPAASAPAGQGQPGAVVTLLIESRSRPAVQSTLAMAEVLSGYVHAHAARQELRRTLSSSMALDVATRLLGAINNAPNFKGVCLQLVNETARQFGADRVALGWATDDRIKAIAISDTEKFDRRTAMVQRLEAAMEECLDQAQPVVHPAPVASGDVMLSQAITHAHKQLTAHEPGLRVCSAPLRAGDDVVGVVTLESKGDGSLDLRRIELLQSTLDLLAPVLKVRRNDDRNLALRAKDSAVRAGAWLVGPRHTVWKLVAATLLLALLFTAVYRTTYRVGATAHLQPVTRRVISAPFEGTLARLGEGIEPGVTVKAGQLLAELDSAELRLQAAEADARMNQALKAVGQAMKEGRTSEAQKSQAQADAARAQLDLFRSRIERARITAPIDGVIISGDLKDHIGAAARTGDELFQIAPLDAMEIVLRVDERDISLVRDALDRAKAEGRPARGSAALRSAPGKEFAFIIQRIVPLAEAAEGRNQFEVRGRLETSASWMRPGMEGYAKIDTTDASLLWIGTRRVIDTVRLWLW